MTITSYRNNLEIVISRTTFPEAAFSFRLIFSMIIKENLTLYYRVLSDLYKPWAPFLPQKLHTLVTISYTTSTGKDIFHK